MTGFTRAGLAVGVFLTTVAAVRSGTQENANTPPAGLSPVMTIGMQVGFSGVQSAVGELLLSPATYTPSAEAAQRLGVSLRTLFYKIERYGID